MTLHSRSSLTCAFPIQEPAKYLVRRKDDIDETLIGKSMADDQETSEIFIHACERHIKNIDTEVLRRNRPSIWSSGLRGLHT